METYLVGACIGYAAMYMFGSHKEPNVASCLFGSACAVVGLSIVQGFWS